MHIIHILFSIHITGFIVYIICMCVYIYVHTVWYNYILNIVDTPLCIENITPYLNIYSYILLLV